MNSYSRSTGGSRQNDCFGEEKPSQEARAKDQHHQPGGTIEIEDENNLAHPICSAEDRRY
jgi:hypothetical protein